MTNEKNEPPEQATPVPKARETAEANQPLQTHRDQKLLSQAAMDLINFPSDENIYQFLAERLRKLGRGRIVVTSSFDFKAEQAHIRAVAGLDSHTDKVLNLLGQHPVGMTISFEDKAEGLYTGELEKVSGLYGLCFGQVPRGICQALEKVLNIGDIYAMGFVEGDNLFGSAVLIMPQGAELKNPQAIETFMGLAAVTLQRQKTEEALRESERRYRDLFEQVPVGLFQTTPDGRYLDANQTIVEMLGCPDKETLLAQDVSSFYADPEKREQWKALMEHEDVVQGIEAKWRRYDGQTIWVLESARTVRDDKGQVLYYEGSVENITERKRTEKMLQKSENRFRNLFQMTPDTVFLLSPDGVFKEINAPGITGYGREAFIGKHFQDVPFIAERSKQNGTESLARRLNGQDIPPYVIEVYTKEGETRYAEVNATPIVEDGEVTGILGIVRDVTRRQRLTDALRQSEREKDLILNATSEMFAYYNTELEIQWVNEASGESVGISPEELVGRHCYEIWQQRDSPCEACPVLKALETGEPQETEMATPDGRIWHLRGYPVFEEGEVIGLVELGQDVTEHKRAEEALQRRNRDLALLHRVSQAFSSSLDLDEVLETVLKEVRHLLDVVACSVWLTDPESDEAVCQHAIGPKRELVCGQHLPPGVGLIGEAISRGESILVPDARKDERHFKEIDQQTGLELRSILATPLQAGEHVIGAIEVMDSQSKRFTQSDLALLESLAAPASIAIENAWLYEAEQKRRDVAETLRRASITLSSTLELDEVLETLLEEVQSVIPYESACIQRLQDDHLEIVTCQGFENPDDVLGRTFPLNPECPTYQVVMTKTPLAIENIPQEFPHFQEKIATYHPGRIRSWLGVPLITKDEVTGVIALNRIEVQPYTTEEIKLVTAFASQASIALENARLFGEAQQEIIERQQLEKALRESQDYYRSLFEDSPISLWEEDFSAVKAYLDHLRDTGTQDIREYFEQHPESIAHCASLVKVININRATVEMYKAESKDELLADLETVFSEETYPVFVEELMAIVEGRTRLELEIANQTLTGKTMHLNMRWQVAPGHEKTFSKVMVSFVDITERKRAEQEIEHYAADLERSNQELQQFAYIVSHDLQSPLRVMAGYLDLLEKRYGAQLDDRAEKYITNAVNSAERMKEMIHALLNLSRVETRGENFAPTDCNAVLKHTLESLAIVHEESEAQITHDHLPTVMADEAQLSQVFQNLIANAIKFKRDDKAPHIHISATAQTHEGKEEWLFSFEDNGIGIDPEHTDRIFEIFQRLHTDEEYPGLGIGLALCKRIVDRHGGRIWVESTLGQGSTFYFTLPIRSESK